jgi:hypothetical protein
MSEKEPIKEESILNQDNNKEIPISGKEVEVNPSEQLNEKIEEPEKAITDMEFYHPHGIHHEKKFIDYIFEFFMLFIAITAGFFMENMRETFADRHKEKEYISSMVRDLGKDTLQLNQKLEYNQNKIIKGIDSLTVLLKNPEPNIDTQKLYYYIFSYLNQYLEFSPHNTTIIQLKNSGGLRLIKNKSVSDSIVNYYSNIDNFLETNGKSTSQFLDDNLKLEMMFLDFNAALEDNKWIINDTTKLEEFRNRIAVTKNMINWENHRLKDINFQASSLLKYLKKEYKIDN